MCAGCAYKPKENLVINGQAFCCAVHPEGPSGIPCGDYEEKPKETPRSNTPIRRLAEVNFPAYSMRLPQPLAPVGSMEVVEEVATSGQNNTIERLLEADRDTIIRLIREEAEIRARRSLSNEYLGGGGSTQPRPSNFHVRIDWPVRIPPELLNHPDSVLRNPDGTAQ
jgi:hypothetical protein